MVAPLSQRTIPPSPAEPIGHQNFALHPATSARVRDIHRASVNQQFRCQGINFRNARADTAARPYESLYQVRFAIGKLQSTVINKSISATRGGMLSGRAASRTGQLSDTASQHTFGGWQVGHHPRWQYTSPHLEIITLAIGDGRPT